MVRNSRFAAWGRLAAVLLLVWSVVGGLPASPALAAPGTPWAAPVQKCPPVAADGQIVYGCNELSRHLQQARLWLQQNKPRGTTDNLFKNAGRSNYAIAKLADGKYIIGYSDAKGHAEQRLLAQMDGSAKRMVFDPAKGTVTYQPAKASKITAGFSELEPCAKTCDPALKNSGVRSKFTWSWRWNPKPGESKEQGLKYRDESNNSKTGQKQLALKQLKVNKAPGPIFDQPAQSGVGKAVQRQAGLGRPGGIDFASVQLRYVSDGAKGNTYSFKAPVTPGKPSTDGTTAHYAAYTALDVWMTVQPSRFWVNLNPDEPNRVIDPNLAQTDVGRVLLESDLLLKKSGTKLIDPNSTVGAEFWRRMRAANLGAFCKRDWIVPKEAVVREAGDEVYILDAPLEVKSEGADFQMPGSDFDCPADSKAASEIYRSVIVPELTRLINESPEYVDLRRVYISRVAAEWYRQRLAKAGTADEFGVDSNDVSALESVDEWKPKDVYDAYLKDLNSVRYETPDGFVVTAGGVDFTQPVKVDKVNEATFKQKHAALPATVTKSLSEVTKDDKESYNGGADEVPDLLPAPSQGGGTVVGQPGGQGGGLPITGAPIFAIVATAVAMILLGVLFQRRRRKIRFTADR